MTDRTRKLLKAVRSGIIDADEALAVPDLTAAERAALAAALAE